VPRGTAKKAQCAGLKDNFEAVRVPPDGWWQGKGRPSGLPIEWMGCDPSSETDVSLAGRKRGWR